MVSRTPWVVLATVLAIGSSAHAKPEPCAAQPVADAPPTSDAPSETTAPDPAATPPVNDDPSGASPAPNPAAPTSTAEALGRTPRRVKCLDESLVDEFGRVSVRKGVQPRDFRKALRVSLSIMGGVRAGDLLDTQWQGGASLAFWPFEELGFDADFRVSPMTLRIERAATSFTQENRYPDGVRRNLSYTALGHVLFSPIHTKLRARGDRIIHGDFVFVGGAGAVIHQSVQAAAFDVGMSLYLYPTKWLSVRIDLSDLILAQEAVGSRRISNNLQLSLGVGFWIPPRRKR
ncbi:MAG TPA: outer membrane beta-barrel domain-containing protein [Nannocystaceae bacterium]|nr:outer membrane beta-barrel domain-containing protein [Nannocystaceae bacterium]